MSTGGRPPGRNIRTGIHGAAYDDLLHEVARAARKTSFSELKAIGLLKKEINLLRQETPEVFGWDRLHKVALALGVPISPIWAKHEKREGVAA